MIEMEIVGVQEVLPASVPVVLLREVDGERLLPIFIGMPEATAISLALAGQDPPRPMTHDLMATLLATFSATLERVVVTELRDRTFFAEMYLRGPVGVEVVSARPSDAIALAIRTGTSVFAAEEVLDEAAYLPPTEEKSVGTEEQVEEFREFLEQVSPEDFVGE